MQARHGTVETARMRKGIGRKEENSFMTDQDWFRFADDARLIASLWNQPGVDLDYYNSEIERLAKKYGLPVSAARAEVKSYE